MKNAGRMLTTMRAVTNFMETLTILMFPIGLFFVAGGVYIVNSTGGDPTSAITALAIFAVGCFIIEYFPAKILYVQLRHLWHFL